MKRRRTPRTTLGGGPPGIEPPEEVAIAPPEEAEVVPEEIAIEPEKVEAHDTPRPVFILSPIATECLMQEWGIIQ